MSDLTDALYGEALEEAYVNAPSDDVILHTMEFRHPAFIENGIPIAVRVVTDPGDQLVLSDPEVYGIELKLEDDAPMNPGEIVKFISCMFDFTLPGANETALPEVEISLDNVSREIGQYLDAAAGERATLELTYREYLASDLLAPQFILNGLSVSKVRSNIFRVIGSASFVDLLNSSFPKKLYRPTEFRGLIQ